MNIEIIPISKRINKNDFDCGIEDLNQYLRQFAIPNDKKNIGKTFAAVYENNKSQVLGYYSVSMAQILFNELPDSIKKGIPKYPVPAMRIGKLAVDLRFQGNNIGALLLRDAFLRAINVSSEVAIYCIIVDAINKKAKSFYMKYGFIPFYKNPLTLVLPIKTVKDAII